MPFKSKLWLPITLFVLWWKCWVKAIFDAERKQLGPLPTSLGVIYLSLSGADWIITFSYEFQVAISSRSICCANMAPSLRCVLCWRPRNAAARLSWPCWKACLIFWPLPRKWANWRKFPFRSKSAVARPASNICRATKILRFITRRMPFWGGTSPLHSTDVNDSFLWFVFSFVSMITTTVYIQTVCVDNLTITAIFF